MFLYFNWDFSLLQIAIFALLTCLFIGILVYLYAIYNRIYRYHKQVICGKVNYTEQLPSVSVIVYAHADDSEGLCNLLPSLLTQQYPDYEVIIVNDGAVDGTNNVVSHYESEYSNLYQTYIPNTVYNVSRKKLGITLGIKAAKKDIIIVTEANCRPQSDKWLHTIARNFVEGIDIVLGYTHMVDSSNKRNNYYYTFDRMVFALRFLAYAVLHRPYMGMGSNMAYRKAAFFANKGFSATLNLQFGDDDLFINEIATRQNTRIEISPESIVESHNNDSMTAWEELRMRYRFTSKYLHTSSQQVFAIETILHLLFWATSIISVIIGMPNIICIATTLLVVLLYWIFTWHIYLKTARLLGEKIHSGMVPFYYLIRPYYSLYYAIKSKKQSKNNFTWQYLR